MDRASIVRDVQELQHNTRDLKTLMTSMNDLLVEQETTLRATDDRLEHVVAVTGVALEPPPPPPPSFMLVAAVGGMAGGPLGFLWGGAWGALGGAGVGSLLACLRHRASRS